MPQHIQAPDGGIIQFPDEMDDKSILNAMRTLFPPAGSSQPIPKGLQGPPDNPVFSKIWQGVTQHPVSQALQHPLDAILSFNPVHNIESILQSPDPKEAYLHYLGNYGPLGAVRAYTDPLVDMAAGVEKDPAVILGRELPNLLIAAGAKGVQSGMEVPWSRVGRATAGAARGAYSAVKTPSVMIPASGGSIIGEMVGGPKGAAIGSAVGSLPGITAGAVSGAREGWKLPSIRFLENPSLAARPPIPALTGSNRGPELVSPQTKFNQLPLPPGNVESLQGRLAPGQTAPLQTQQQFKPLPMAPVVPREVPPPPSIFPGNPSLEKNPPVPPLKASAKPAGPEVTPTGGTPEVKATPLLPKGTVLPENTQPVNLDPNDPIAWATANRTIHATTQEMELPEAAAGKNLPSGSLSQSAKDAFGTEYRKLSPYEIYQMNDFIRRNSKLPKAGDIPTTKYTK